MSLSKYDKVMNLAVRRGFLWPSFEIYGGQSGFYDLGPLGVMFKNNIVELWRDLFVRNHQDFVVEIETPIINPAVVFKASGHEEHFTDYAVECKACHRVYRADHLVEEKLGISAEGLNEQELDKIIKDHGIKCPLCGGELSVVKRFLLLFQTYIGPYSPENLAYLRPEAAQGMFVNFKRVYELMKRRLPLGIAQIGKVARNEISPRQGPIRLREFTIMEIEFFYDDQNPQCEVLEERCSNDKIRILTAEQKISGESKPITISSSEAYKEKVILSPWLAYWMCIASKFISMLGVPFEDTYFEEKLPTERAHYSKQTFDQIVAVDKWGKLEVSGHAYRHSYDLEKHIDFSKSDLYAIRQLKEPITVKKKTVKFDKMAILNIFGRQAGEVFRRLTKYVPQDLLRILEGVPLDEVEIDGIRIPKSVFVIEDVEEKVWVEKIVPHVAEPSFGLERLLYVALEYAYRELEDGRIVLSLPRRLAPVKIGIATLVNKPQFESLAMRVYEMLRGMYYVTILEGDSIGKKYAYADEIGIPFTITIDYDSVADGSTVTIRDRDTRKQIRVAIKDITNVIGMGLEGYDITALGYPVIEPKD
ncbi:MAG: glycine--tRNA ligase [Ignisphaera sp.]|uniref:glycine--tRNA ligase n=1 Tax=Ignisphaera aggregans TaxID=334771 RepID=A0A7C4NN53_9CREN